ncbi:MAG: amidohydrolase family protein [Armatimonadota bacterium]
MRTLEDYHKVIDGIFARFGPRAVATKNQMNYSRRLDFELVKGEEIAGMFERSLHADAQLTPQENKAIQDHLFHYCLDKADEYSLPVKLHCGYYAGHSRMPLHILRYNGGDICNLLMSHSKTPFVFMHINYPYQDELIAVCKHYANAYADMCWAWIINPTACVRFLKEFLMAVPATKILTFGGDYRMVETVVGHAAVARQGIAQAISELMEEGWLLEKDVEYVVRRIMVDNARELFKIREKFGL